MQFNFSENDAFIYFELSNKKEQLKLQFKQPIVIYDVNPLDKWLIEVQEQSFEYYF
jgi:hypothetical protein